MAEEMKYMMRAEMETKTDRPEIFPLSETFKTAVNDFLLNKSYGNDIDTFMHVLRIYIVEDLGFYKPVRQYNKKEKALIISANISGKEYMQADEKKILEMMAWSFLKTIKEIDEMRMKPKNFDRVTFYNDINLFFIEQEWIKTE